MNKHSIPNEIAFIVDAMQNVQHCFYNIYVKNKTKLVTIKRERVYCYELYHQMRLLQENKKYKNKCFVNNQINGEIDKNGHPIIKEKFNPDFVIHKQARMNYNSCVIEVKCNFDKIGIEKDIRNLICMTHCYNYKIGVFVFVNYEKKHFEKMQFIKEMPEYNKGKDKIYIITQGENYDKPKAQSIDSFLSEVN